MGVIWETCERVLVMYASRIVEEGSKNELFDNPLHPYTQGLLKSMPVLAGEGERLPCIKGQVPSPDALPKGCNFAGRCPHAQAVCREKEPPLAAFGERRSACFFSDRWVRS
jgi:oligopeptide/dipeptide ABC transporter ATP-binding protein